MSQIFEFTYFQIRLVYSNDLQNTISTSKALPTLTTLVTSFKGVKSISVLFIILFYPQAPRAEVVLVLSRSRSVTPADRSYDLIDAATYNFINSSRPPKILESPLDSKSLSGGKISIAKFCCNNCLFTFFTVL